MTKHISILVQYLFLLSIKICIYINIHNLDITLGKQNPIIYNNIELKLFPTYSAVFVYTWIFVSQCLNICFNIK